MGLGGDYAAILNQFVNETIDLGIYNPSEEANLKVEQTSFGDIPAIVIHDEEVEQDVAVRNDSEPDDEPPPYTEQDQTDLPKDPDSFYDASSQNHGLNPFYTERDEEEGKFWSFTKKMGD